MTIPASQPNVYTASKQLIAGSDFNNVVNQLNSFQTLTPGTNAQNTAFINAANVEIPAGAAAGGVTMPTSFPGLIVNFINNSGNTQNIYPATGDQMQTGNAPITYGAANAAVTSATLTSYTFVCIKKGFWQRAVFPGVA